MDDISGFDSSAANPALTVTVTVGGKIAAVTVEIVELVIPNISIDDRVIIEVASLPDKADAEFNPTLVIGKLAIRFI